MGEKMTGGLILGISLIFMAVGIINFGQVTDASSAILSYAYSANGSITDATFTGLTSIVGITPLLALLGYVTVCVLSGFMGIQVIRGASEARLTPGGVLLQAISLIFFAVGLRIFPVFLDGVAYMLHGGGAGVNPSFTGFEPILLMTPMLGLLGYVAATVLSGYFGMKKLSSSSSEE
jgi:hypothetical protein